MANPIRLVHDVAAGTVEEIEMTAKEVKELEDRWNELEQEEQQKENEKQNALQKLADIGLTLEDLQALGLSV